MKKKAGAIAIKSFALRFAMYAVLGTAFPATAQDATTTYQSMAPVDQYLMADQGAEIALARSAAPESIAGDAEVLVLRRHGFETAVKGKNGFVCIVARSWTSASDSDFWDPKVRVPMCLNAAAARAYLPRITKITGLILAGDTQAQRSETIAATVDKKELPATESREMCYIYMRLKQGYAGDRTERWPHQLMFSDSQTGPATWGANLPGSPHLWF